MTNYDAIVIGAGHNGLTTALQLSRKGLKVLCLDARNQAGGLAVGEEFHPGFVSEGFYHDSSTVRPQVFDLFNLSRHGLEFSMAGPDIFLPDLKGPGILLTQNEAECSQEISRYRALDAQALKDHRAFLSRIRKVVLRLLTEEIPDITQLGPGVLFDLGKKAVSLRLMGAKDMTELLRIAPMAAADWAQNTFRNAHLQAGLAFPTHFASWTGPWSPATTANLILWECASQVRIRGGARAFVEALTAACREHHVDMKLNSRVKSILCEKGAALGVRLLSGEEIRSRVVVSGADPKSTLLRMLPPLSLSQKETTRIKNFRTRGITAKVNLAIRGELRFKCREDLKVQNARLFDSIDETERAFDSVKYGRFSERPVLDVAVSEHPGSAPKGHQSVSVLVFYAPYELRGGWTGERKKNLYEKVLARIEEYCPGIKEQVLGHEVLTPLDIEEKYGVTGGHIHHGEQGLDQILIRPTPECAEYKTPIKNLFLCGSGTHPGGGLSCAPGLLASLQVLKSL